MTQPTLEELELELAYNDALTLLTYSASHSLTPHIRELVSEKHRQASNAYFRVKFKKAFDLFGTD